MERISIEQIHLTIADSYFAHGGLEQNIGINELCAVADAQLAADRKVEAEKDAKIAEVKKAEEFYRVLNLELQARIVGLEERLQGYLGLRNWRRNEHLLG